MRNTNPPTKALSGPRDGQVFEMVGDPFDDLVDSVGGLDPVWVRLVEVEEAVLEGGHAEAVVLLLDPLDLAVGLGRGHVHLAGKRVLMLDDLGLRVEALVAHAVPALVGGLVDEAPLLQQNPKVVDGTNVVGVSGPDETVVVDAGHLSQLLEFGCVLIAELLGQHSGGGGSELDLDAVLVGAGAEERLVAQQGLPALEHVGQHHRVHVPDVWCCGGGTGQSVSWGPRELGPAGKLGTYSRRTACHIPALT